MGDYSEKLVESLEDIVSALNEIEVLQKIARRATEITESLDTMVFRCDGDSEILTCIAQVDSQPSYVGVKIHKNEHIAGKAWNTGRPIIVNNYLNWDDAYKAGDRKVVHAMGTPLIANGETLGVMVSIRDEGDGYSEKEFDRFQTFAMLASLELSHAIVREQLVVANSELKKLYDIQSLELQEAEQELQIKNEKLIQKNRELNDVLIHIDQIQDSKQTLLAEYIHDDTLQMLYAGTLLAKSAIVAKDKHSDNLNQALTELYNLLQRMEKSLRRTISTLKPFLIETNDIYETIKNYVQNYQSKSGIKTSFIAEDRMKISDERINVVIFQIVKEAIVNAYHHSKCSKIDVKVEKMPEFLQISVADDGVGLPPNYYKEGHFGIRIMKMRANGIGGKVVIKSEAGKGTCVVLGVPYEMLKSKE